MEYLSDKIGNSFIEWERGTSQFITAPTGSGKTTFVLNNLFEHALNKKKKILYLVNRKILKKQLEERIEEKRLWGDLNNCIKIVTYQTIEEMVKSKFFDQKWYPALFEKVDTRIQFFDNKNFPSDLLLLKELIYINYARLNNENYDYIICDECHYFYQDSMYNTYTVLSYEWVLAEVLLSRTIGIFMSATIDMVKNKIIDDIVTIKRQLTQWNNQRIAGWLRPEFSFIYTCLYRNNPTHFMKVIKSEVKYNEISGVPDYSYLNLKVFEEISDIPQLIEEDKNKKWIIFINDIKTGKIICKEIKEHGVENTVLIHSGYDKDEGAINEVDEITSTNQMNSQVIITTSVMDNGISIEDIELRNMVILADTKEDFIQMLGRKRRDASVEKINVYICKRSKEYFKKRQESVNKILEFIQKNFDSSPVKLLGKVMSDYRSYKLANQTLYLFNTALTWNEWSLYKSKSLNEYYQRIIERFDKEGDEAFLNEQAEWLEITVNQTNMEFIREKEDKLRESVNAVLQEYSDKELNKDEYTELVIKIRDDLKKLLSMKKDKCQEFGTIFKELKKNDRCISAEKFVKISALAELDYNMIKKGRSVYCIIHK